MTHRCQEIIIQIAQELQSPFFWNNNSGKMVFEHGFSGFIGR